MTAVETTPATESVPSAAELVERIRELHPLLKKNAAAGEQDRRVAEESIRALTDAGAFKVAIPRRYGGYETSMRTMLDVSAAVAEADGGTAWVVTLINVCNRSALVPILVLVLAGPQLGMGRAALEYVIDTAHLHAYRAADDIDRAAERGVYPDLVARARVRSDTGCAIESVTKAIDILLSAHGAGSFAEVSPLQRIWRDSATAARHAVILPAVSYEVYGKALLGVEDTITPLI
ncbi:acyl-CoA dehydrogenase family protein [Nocardia zapadnayensis]|uniref:acyl-CoA dehydrogenase family protein n=1 Tax=Nocardia rhamnosiphila TaxID=426716 RepID=UPI002245202B|nr:acyl-CoA dehydrogenase family protein [Nocardia zapadnayensis]MCX0275202.1 acyl-CoA dehydrogenase family protein [Nocardia zapadnayensis]